LVFFVCLVLAESREPGAPLAPAASFELSELSDFELSELDDDWPESSAAAIPTCGPANEKPHSAALTPADAAPSWSHRLTPRSSERTDRLLERAFAWAPAIGFPLVNYEEAIPHGRGKKGVAESRTERVI
jgi:hypothetical protein